MAGLTVEIKLRLQISPAYSGTPLQYYGPRNNEDPVITNNIILKARQNYSKIWGNKPRYNEIPATTN